MHVRDPAINTHKKISNRAIATFTCTLSFCTSVLLKMDLKGCQASVEEYIYVLEDIIAELEQIRKEVQSWHTGSMAGKTTGVAVGAVGTVISIVGVIGAPLTGGLSLALTGAGIATGLLGAATSTASEITDTVSDK